MGTFDWYTRIMAQENNRRVEKSMLKVLFWFNFLKINLEAMCFFIVTSFTTVLTSLDCNSHILIDSKYLLLF